jgi:DNA-binding IclR family transcriptional regulator
MAQSHHSVTNGLGAVAVNEGEANSSFARGLRVFTTIAEKGSISAGAISDALNMPLSSVYRYLRTLQGLDLVIQVNNMYQLGSSFRILTGQGLDPVRLAEAGLPVLRRLASETGETADLLGRFGLSAICVQEAQSSFTMRIGLHVGHPMELHAGAEQRVLLAFAPSQVIKEVVYRGLRKYTTATLPADKLLSSLEQIRATKIAVSRGEYVPGAVAVAVPIFVQGSAVYSVGVAGPKERCTSAWIHDAAASLARASLELTDSFSGCRF